MTISVKEHGIYQRRDGLVEGPMAPRKNPLEPYFRTHPWSSTRIGTPNYSWTDDGRFGPRIDSVSSEDLVREIVVGEGWKPWSGGENPVPGTLVKICMRSWHCTTQESARSRWSHAGFPGDILAYRIVEQKAAPAPSAATGGIGTKVVGTRDFADRENELLKANVALEERARKAEAWSVAMRAGKEKLEARIAELEARLAVKPEFYTVWRSNGGSSTVKHATLEKAVLEAKRLSEVSPGQLFYVMAPIGNMLAEVPPAPAAKWSSVAYPQALDYAELPF